MLENHVREEVERQAGAYADAYKRYMAAESRINELMAQVDEKTAEQDACVAEMKEAEGVINSLLEDIDDDESVHQVSKIIGEFVGEMSVVTVA